MDPFLSRGDLGPCRAGQRVQARRLLDERLRLDGDLLEVGHEGAKRRPVDPGVGAPRDPSGNPLGNVPRDWLRRWRRLSMERRSGRKL